MEIKDSKETKKESKKSKDKPEKTDTDDNNNKDFFILSIFVNSLFISSHDTLIGTIGGVFNVLDQYN